MFERPVEVISSRERNTEGMVVPMTWPPSLVYGITPSASSEDDKPQQKELERQFVDIKGKIQTPLEGKEFITPTAESTQEKKLRLTPSYEKRKDREKNQYQVSKDILNETIDEEVKMISIEVQKAVEEKFTAEQEAIQLKLQQEKLQREQEELARKQAEELLVKEQQQ